MVVGSCGARADGGAEEGFRPFEPHLDVARSLDRQNTACCDVQVMIDLRQIVRREPTNGSLGSWSPLDSLRALRSISALATLEALAALEALRTSIRGGTLAPLETWKPWVPWKP